MDTHVINRYHLRKNFARIKKILDMPNLLDVQKNPMKDSCSGMLRTRSSVILAFTVFSRVSFP